MDHLRIRYVVHPETGRRYALPAGGAAGDGDGGGGDSGDAGDGDGDDGGGETPPDGDGDGSDSGKDEDDGKGDEGAGSKSAVLADLAKERDRRQAAEAELERVRREHESEDEAHDREIRETAQAPAIRALRVTAVETAARAAGFHDPADAAALLDLSSIDVDLDADLPSADRTAAEALVTELAERKPHLVASDGEGGGVPKGGSDTQGDGKRTSTDPNTTLRDLARTKLGMGG